MRDLHLNTGDAGWCDAAGDEFVDMTEDPRVATCVECLRKAAAFGAAAAMRCAAVEANGPSDPELAKERDEAMKRLNAITDALETQHCFFCNDCMKLKRADERALSAGKLSWCTRCAPKRVPT